MVTTATSTHITALTDLGADNYRRDCSCGWQGRPWNHRTSPGIRMAAVVCPEDRTVVALATLQFGYGGLFDSVPTDCLIHLVRTIARGGTPGPTLCGIDRFAPDAPGWSVDDGVSGPGLTLKPCPGCADVARTEFAGLPVSGSVGGKEMAAELGVEHKSWGAR